MGWFYGDLSPPYAPRSCQNVEVSGLQVEVARTSRSVDLQVEVISWLCSAHFVSGKKKHDFLSHDLQESGYARPVTIIVIQLHESESSSRMLHQIMTDLSTSKLETI